MKNLYEYLLESCTKLPKYKEIDGKVKVVLLYGKMDDDLKLTNANNIACFLMDSEDGKYYITINGGVRWNDKHVWKSQRDIPYYKDIDWKDDKDVNLTYAWAGTIGATPENKVKVKYAEVDKSIIDKLFEQNNKTLNVSVSYSASTADLVSFLTRLRKENKL